MSERERSALYPSATWQECLDFIEKFKGLKVKKASYEEMAKTYGVSLNTNSFKSKITTTRQFGLISTSAGSAIELTEAATKILYPISDDSSLVSFECFATPPLYKKLIDAYNGRALPNATILGNVLMNNHNITAQVKDVAAKYFLLNADELGFIRGGILDYSLHSNTVSEHKNKADDVIDIQEEKLEHSSSVVAEQNEIKETLPAHKINTDETDCIVQNIPVKSGKVARIVIPLDATEDDLWIIRDSLDIIMRRKFKIDLNETKTE